MHWQCSHGAIRASKRSRAMQLQCNCNAGGPADMTVRQDEAQVQTEPGPVGIITEPGREMG
jgi:hypothetical protein